MASAPKKILLIDFYDSRRASRIALLKHAGYEVTPHIDHISAEGFELEGTFDLVILCLHENPQLAVEYSNRLSRCKPRLPILLLKDSGIVTPIETICPSIEAGIPRDLMDEIARLLVESTHIREL